MRITRKAAGLAVSSVLIVTTASVALACAAKTSQAATSEPAATRPSIESLDLGDNQYETVQTFCSHHNRVYTIISNNSAVAITVVPNDKSCA